MPAGDLVVADWQLELRSTLMGETTSFGLDRDRGGVQGLGVPAAKTADTVFAHKAGVYAAEDYQGPRVVTVALVVEGSDPADAFDKLRTLRTAWAPSTTDIALYGRFPGAVNFRKWFVNGRPRGLDEDLSQSDFGLIPVLGSFFCPDPTLNYVSGV